MKRVLLDQGLAPQTAQLLRIQGWEALHVTDVHLDKVDDSEIIEFARRNNWTCVTLDHDFHAHLALNRADGSSIVLLRVEGLDSEAQASLICKVWDACEASIQQGAAVSADANSVHIRLLPLR